MNEQQKRLDAVRNQAANANSATEKSRADAELVRIISENPRSR